MLCLFVAGYRWRQTKSFRKEKLSSQYHYVFIFGCFIRLWFIEHRIKVKKKFVNDPKTTDPWVNTKANVTSISQHNLKVISFVNKHRVKKGAPTMISSLWIWFVFHLWIEILSDDTCPISRETQQQQPFTEVTLKSEWITIFLSLLYLCLHH